MPISKDTMGLYRSPHQALYLNLIPVPQVGFEPTILVEAVSKTAVYACFTTEAEGGLMSLALWWK